MSDDIARFRTRLLGAGGYYPTDGWDSAPTWRRIAAERVPLGPEHVELLIASMPMRTDHDWGDYTDFSGDIVLVGGEIEVGIVGEYPGQWVVSAHRGGGESWLSVREKRSGEEMGQITVGLVDVVDVVWHSQILWEWASAQ